MARLQPGACLSRRGPPDRRRSHSDPDLKNPLRPSHEVRGPATPEWVIAHGASPSCSRFLRQSRPSTTSKMVAQSPFSGGGRPSRCPRPPSPHSRSTGNHPSGLGMRRSPRQDPSPRDEGTRASRVAGGAHRPPAGRGRWAAGSGLPIDPEFVSVLGPRSVESPEIKRPEPRMDRTLGDRDIRKRTVLGPGDLRRPCPLRALPLRRRGQRGEHGASSPRSSPSRSGKRNPCFTGSAGESRFSEHRRQEERCPSRTSSLACRPV